MQDAEISRVLAKHQIGLTVTEARRIEEMLGRPPTLTEATIWGIQGSEHCSYKSSRRFLKAFPTTGKHVILGPKEDSGIVAITDAPEGKRWGLVVSHESHNHPSQIVPFEGAATGVGGCVRDVACMGARVIGCLDCLRLGDLLAEETRSIALEVARGVAGYANPLGIPNLGGDTVFDRGYNKSCLVNVVTVGIVREDEIIHSYVPKEAGKVGYDIIIIGKATDRSGFGGAAFASVTMNEEDAEKNTGAVQEPNPFLERHVLQSTYALFDWLKRENKLHLVSFKDLGAGGVVCASVEQVAPLGFGATVELTKVHTSLPNLPPQVIACAETQERFCWICHPSLTSHILNHYNEVWDLPNVAEHAGASVIGKVHEDPLFTLTYKGEVVCSATSELITSGLQYVRPTKEVRSTFTEPNIEYRDGSVTVAGKTLPLETVFIAMLQHPNHASKDCILRHYDKDILGNSLIEAGEADATVIMPLADLKSYEVDGAHPGWETLSASDARSGVAMAAGGNNRYGRIDPFLQGANAVAENVRNLAAVGAVPRALSDCLNYGNPEIPEQLFALEQGIAGIAEAAKNIIVEGECVPVISGNVSLYNATKDGPIDPTANVCVFGILRDASKAISMKLQSPNSHILLLGERKSELGGSAYYQILEECTKSPWNSLLGANVPRPDYKELSAQVHFLSSSIADGLILSAHDISEGGLLLAAFEMTNGQRGRTGNIGIDIDISSLGSTLRIDELLLSETGGFLLEVADTSYEALKKAAKKFGCSLQEIGTTIARPEFIVRQGSIQILQQELSSLHRCWKMGLETAITQ